MVCVFGRPVRIRRNFGVWLVHGVHNSPSTVTSAVIELYIHLYSPWKAAAENRTTKKRQRGRQTDRQTNRQTSKQSTDYISQITCQQIDAHSLEAFPANTAHKQLSDSQNFRKNLIFLVWIWSVMYQCEMWNIWWYLRYAIVNSPASLIECFCLASSSFTVFKYTWNVLGWHLSVNVIHIYVSWWKKE